MENGDSWKKYRYLCCVKKDSLTCAVDPQPISLGFLGKIVIGHVFLTWRAVAIQGGNLL